MQLLTRLVSSRLRLVIALTMLGFLAIALYLFHLQINHVHLFFSMAQKNFMRTEKITSPRGTIIDSQGNVLATNRPVYSVFWQGTGEKMVSDHQKELIVTLSKLFDVPSNFSSMIQGAEKKGTRLLIASDIAFDQITRLLERYPYEKNIFLEKTYKRSYPYKDVACHLVGYLGLDAETTGKTGLELQCNKVLRGQSGKIVKIINSVGRHLEAHTICSALAGKTLQTTLDLDLQLAAEELFPADFEGCLLCMDDDGGLEVVLSRPSFDPTLFLQPLSVKEWQKLQEKQGFINRAFNACYPPASLFKLVVLAAALETGIISTGMRWHCIGHSEFKGRFYNCNNKSGHGLISTEQALAHSCNIPFYEIGKKINIDTLADYAYRLGLGAKTGLLLPEKKGLIPTRTWKRTVKKRTVVAW